MTKIFHRLITLLLTAVLTLAALPAAAEYTCRDAYMRFAVESPDFILKVLDSGGGEVSESTILEFMISLQRSFYRQNRIEPITEENFKEAFIYWVKTLSNASRFTSLQDAIYRAYPEASRSLQEGRIHSSIQPLFDEIRDMVLGRGMLDRMEADTRTDFRMLKAEIPELDCAQLEEPELPAAVKVLSESGLWINMPVSWYDEPDTAYAGKALVCGRAAMPVGCVPGGFDGRVSLRLTVKPLRGGGNLGSLSWSLRNGVLTVSGSGRMPDFASPKAAPWAAVRDAVNKIVIEQGVTHVGGYAFAGMKNLASRSAALPASIDSVGAGAFAGTELDSAVVYDGWESIGDGAFDPGTTIYGGLPGCPVYYYANREGLRYVPRSSSLPEIVALDASGGQVSVNSMNCHSVTLAFYGSGAELLSVASAPDGGSAAIPAGTKYVKAFCWKDWESRRGQIPLCAARSLRLTA